MEYAGARLGGAGAPRFARQRRRARELLVGRKKPMLWSLLLFCHTALSWDIAILGGLFLEQALAPLLFISFFFAFAWAG